MSRLLIRRLLGLSALAVGLSACSTPAIGTTPRQAVEAPVQLSSTPVTASELSATTAVPTLVPTAAATATWTAIPATDTPTEVPPTDTPLPTDTSVPPTDTPLPTETPVPPTATIAAEAPSATPDTSAGGVNPAVKPNAPGRSVSGSALPRGAIARRPWMVMIDNHPDAYPQSGIDKAAVVFEGLAEYGITRFIATFADGLTADAAEIGPVRSTRVYFAQWAMGFQQFSFCPEGLTGIRWRHQLELLDHERE